ncbi:MAG: hypothetical protein V3R90_05755 [Limibaculum sp.]
MTDTITTAAPALSEGISYSERTRLVAEAHPDLIEALENASKEFYRSDAIWQEEIARHQRNTGLPEQSLESPFGKALREASTAVFAKSRELLTAEALRGPSRPPARGRAYPPGGGAVTSLDPAA